MGRRDLAPSEIRARIMDQHRRVLTHLDDVGQRAREQQDDEAVKRSLAALLPLLDEKMALEDDLLVPCLAELDAFGDVRADQVRCRHARFREWSADVREILSQGGVGLVLRALARELAADLRAELRDEERESLDPEVLKDDLVTSGVGA